MLFSTSTTKAAFKKSAERRRQTAIAWQRERSTQGREIGDLPAVADPRRRARCTRSLAAFCRTYFPQIFYLQFSADHLAAIARLEEAITTGGLFALAMPRGSGKTSLCECAVLWAALTGRRQFSALIGATEDHAQKMLGNIKAALQQNEHLAADWPEACHPIRALNGITQRQRGQLYHGQSTYLQWTTHQIQLPTIESAKSSAALIRVAGLTGHIRGMQHTRPDGKKVRPSLVLLDDPQTDESAHSPAQTETRQQTINGAILGLAGPGAKIAAVCACTIIAPDDLSARLLDRARNPEWTGQRFQLVYQWPTHPEAADHWQRYAEIRAEAFRTGDAQAAAATEYYRQNRTTMDLGAKVAWPHRHFPEELSALQHAYNLRARSEAAFQAEYQNQPPHTETSPTAKLDARSLAEKYNNHDPGQLPADVAWITAGVDIQQNALFWLVAAWAPNFAGHVLAYGCYPDQRRRYFTNRAITNTLQRRHPERGLEGAIHAGLAELTTELFGRRWTRNDGTAASLNMAGIDANWGKSTDTVYAFCRHTPHAGQIYPTHGRYVGAASLPFTEYRRRPGERLGPGWRLPPASPGRAVRHLLFDTNYWKSWLTERLAEPIGSPTAMDLFGSKSAGTDHQLLADHLTAEYGVTVTAKARTVEEWHLRPEATDNHWLDCLAMSAALAALLGASLNKQDKPTAGGSPKDAPPARPAYQRPRQRTAKPL